MRLITWNCQGGFHGKHDFVAALRPDILIVPECEVIPELKQSLEHPPVRSFEWFGSPPKKGLAVFSYGEYTVKTHESYNPDSEFKWIIPLSVEGPLSFVLFAVWTKPLGNHRGTYVRPLFEAFEYYKSLITESDVVWAGDFNSSYSFDTPSRRYKFRDFVTLLEQYNIRSLYHGERECLNGEELDKTFYMYRHAHRGHHIDYVFSSSNIYKAGFMVTVGTHLDWSKRSDHSPLICDFKCVSSEPLQSK